MLKSRVVLLIMAMALLFGIISAPSLLQAAPTDSNWVQVWADECNGSAGSAVDSSKWNLVNSGGGFGNNELQFYTNRTANSYYDGNGNLVIKTIRESYNGYNYTSAKLYSQNKGDWTYCRVSIRARLPQGRCVWPAFWMMPTASRYGGWPVCGEIDIMELRGDQMNKVGGTLHFGNPWKYIGSSYYLPSGQTFDAAYHTFDIEWEAGVFRWYVDGNLYQTRNHPEWYCSGANESTNPYAPFDQNFYLQINTAVGGPATPYTGNQNPDNSVFPQHMYIDYVRVYKRGTPTNPTPTPVQSTKTIPGQIEAESYNAMSGIQTEATSDTGGGLNVGWIETGDWMDYNVNVQTSGSYRVDYRVSSTGTTGRIDLRRGTTTLASTTVPNTGGWQVWTTVTANVNLNSGSQTIRVYASGGGFNINWLRFTSTNPTPTPPPSGNYISIRAQANNNYVCVDLNNSANLLANRTAVDTWEQFQVINNSDGTISLLARANGQYVSADLNNEGRLIANRTGIGTWEKFTRINNSNGTVSLRALANNNYVCADLNNGTALIANRTSASAWEQFAFQ